MHLRTPRTIPTWRHRAAQHRVAPYNAPFQPTISRSNNANGAVISDAKCGKHAGAERSPNSCPKGVLARADVARGVRCRANDRENVPRLGVTARCDIIETHACSGSRAELSGCGRAKDLSIARVSLVRARSTRTADDIRAATRGDSLDNVAEARRRRAYSLIMQKEVRGNGQGVRRSRDVPIRRCASPRR